MSPADPHVNIPSPSQAVDRLRRRLDREALVGTLVAPVAEAVGRVCAEAVYARCSCPTAHVAAMDGVAVRAVDTYGAAQGRALILEPGRNCQRVATGWPLPADTDAVIRREHLEELPDGRVRVSAPVLAWEHVRRMGSDLGAGELVLCRGTRITPYDAGVLLSGGIFDVEIFEPVRVVFIPTGSEILPLRDRPTPRPGEVIESNSPVFCALARRYGAEAVSVPPVPDDPDALEAAVRAALDQGAHVVVVGAGSSVGPRDFSRQVFESLGEVLVRGVAMQPGRPSILGVAQGRLLGCAPGHPVGAVGFVEELLGPLLAWLGRLDLPDAPPVQARLARPLSSRLGLDETVRVLVGRVGGELVALPVDRSEGMLRSLSMAQGVLRVPAASEGLPMGETVDVEPLVSRAGLERVILHVGSHDAAMDLLADELMALPEPLRLASVHAGSTAGLLTLREGAALLAGAHLLDPATGDYNFPAIRRLLPGMKVLALNLAIRHQGLMVAPGNPKGIRGAADLLRPDVRMVTRQKGSGTRVLLDLRLSREGFDPALVQPEAPVETTHRAVALAVRTGAADCGPGIRAAARAEGLDFVPLARERYDLIIPEAHLADPRIETLRAVLASEAFRARMADMGGYDLEFSGRWMEPGQGLGPSGLG